MPASRAAVAVIAVTLFAVGCTQSPSSSALTSPSATSASSAAQVTAASVSIVDDTLLDGNAFTLTAFNGESLLSGINNQGSFSTPYDGSTVFRKAQLDKYPIDPCRTDAENYNNLGSANSEGTLNSVLSAFVSHGCNARIVIAIPPDPIRIRSFRPIP